MGDINDIIEMMSELSISTDNNQRVADFLIPEIQRNIDSIVSSFEMLRRNVGLLSPVITGNAQYNDRVNMIGRECLVLRERLTGAAVGQPLPPMAIENNGVNEIVNPPIIVNEPPMQLNAIETNESLRMNNQRTTDTCVVCSRVNGFWREECQSFCCDNCRKFYHNNKNKSLDCKGGDERCLVVYTDRQMCPLCRFKKCRDVFR